MNSYLLVNLACSLSRRDRLNKSAVVETAAKPVQIARMYQDSVVTLTANAPKNKEIQNMSHASSIYLLFGNNTSRRLALCFLT